MRNRVFSVVLALVSLVLVSASSTAAIKPGPKPIASASAVSGPQSVKVWVSFPDGSVLAGVVSWTGSPEAIDWSTAVVQVWKNGVLTRISSWWLIATVVTTR